MFPEALKFRQNERKCSLHSSIVDHTAFLHNLGVRCLVAKQFSCQEIEQATVVCIAAECVHCHQHHQEDDYDDSSYTTLTQAGLVHSCKRVEYMFVKVKLNTEMLNMATRQ